MSIGLPPLNSILRVKEARHTVFWKKGEVSNRLLGPPSKDLPQEEKGAIKSADSKDKTLYCLHRKKEVQSIVYQRHEAVLLIEALGFKVESQHFHRENAHFFG